MMNISMKKNEKNYKLLFYYNFLNIIMEEFNKKLFEAINNKNINFIDNVSYEDSKLINIKLFENESENPYFNYVKGIYNDNLGYEDFYINDERNTERGNEYYEKAIKYYELACKEINSLKLYESIGHIYWHFYDEEKMLYYFEMAGTKESFDCLAQYYENIENYEKAIYYHELITNKGNVRWSQYKLGELHYEKLNDKTKGLHYYTLYADKGNDLSQLKLGVIYEGISEFEKAKYYYTLSANNGNSDAQYFLASLYDNEFNDKENAKYFYELAAKNGNDNACLHLGSLCESKKDYLNATYLYCKSNHENSKNKLIDMINDNSDSKEIIAENIKELNNMINQFKEENEKLKLELSLIPGYGSEYLEAEKRYNNKDYQ